MINIRIKVYIVTYNNDIVLKNNLDKLYLSDLLNYNYSVYIINNYSRLKGFNNYPNLEILDNVLRPDFSNGHLSRNWNQGLINGFRNLKNPDADIVVLMQNDTFVKEKCFENIIEHHKKYDFIQVGTGDQFMSFNKDSILKLGIFDERFCSIAYQEADYFLSCYCLNKEKITINDFPHKRTWNQIENVFDIFIENKWGMNQYYHSRNWHEYNKKLFNEKWKILPEYWNSLPINLKPLIKRYMYYPYFEKDIQTLEEQNYYII